MEKAGVNLLAIETSTPFCSIAVCRGEDVFARHFEAGQRHAELALDAVDETLREARMSVAELDGIAYGEGPGSFTGLRIACGLAQGLALARALPVAGVSTLAALAEEAGAQRVIACLDARMGEVYHAAYTRRSAGGGTGAEDWNEASPPGVYRPAAVPMLPGDGWIGCGPGFAAHGQALAERYRGQLTALRPELSPTASAVLRLARGRIARGEGSDPAGAVPIYLRDKVALKTSERR